MKNKIFFIILLTALFSQDLSAHNKKLASEAIVTAEEKLTEIEKLDDIKQFIPYKLYSEALMNIVGAKTSLAQNNFGRSYYQASIASIQLDSSVIQARTNKIVLSGSIPATHDKSEDTDPDDFSPGNNSLGNNKIKDKNPLLIERAGFIKKNNVYTRTINDSDLFQTDGNAFITSGKDVLIKIVDLLNDNPESRVSIISHTNRIDNHGIGLRKSDAVRNFISGRGVNSNRITSVSAGNREVVDTGRGYRRISRVEIIITGID